MALSDEVVLTPPDRRAALAAQWVAGQCPDHRVTLAPASADASFRRYFRIEFAPQDRPSLIVMDAPPDREDCRPFVQVAAILLEAGANVPRVLAKDLDQGFLLLSDLGTVTYLAALDAARDAAPVGAAANPGAARIDALYGDAIDALVRIQQASRPGVLPPYDRGLLERELQLFPEWYIARQLGATLTPSQQETITTTFERVLANNLAQQAVFVHRDYHSRNLMVTEPNPGILDFQDAVYGPVTYDLVSLLRDAYIDWSEPQQLDWCIRYWETARRTGLPVAADFGDFYRDFEWMGVQRQLKVLGIFARLCYRDGKRQYLDDQPRVMRYLLDTCRRYEGLGGLARLLDTLEDRRAQVGYTF